MPNSTAGRWRNDSRSRGHDVHVLTTCARSYVDWANAYEPGESIVNGVTVHRFLVDQPRDNDAFNARTEQMLATLELRSLEAQRGLAAAAGPVRARARGVVARRTSPTSTASSSSRSSTGRRGRGCASAAGVCPTVLHPTVHDEPALHFSIFDQLFRTPDVFAFSTQEEVDLVARRFHLAPRGEVIGIGVDLERASGARFREQWPALGDAPYILYVGRVDEGKGAGELYRDFVRYKRDHPGDLQLVFLGEQIATFPAHPDVVLTGFVDYEVRDSALAGALALVQPSSFESFSMILTEAFAQGAAGARPGPQRGARRSRRPQRSGDPVPRRAEEFARALARARDGPGAGGHARRPGPGVRRGALCLGCRDGPLRAAFARCRAPRVDQDGRSIFTGSGGVPIDLLRGGVAMTCRRGERSM